MAKASSPLSEADLFADTLRVEVKSFESLRDIPIAELQQRLAVLAEGNDLGDPLVQDLHDLRSLTTISMEQMNREFPGLPPDSLETTLNLITRPGASVVILRGTDPREPDPKERALGYGVVIRGEENFPDAENIPAELRAGDVCYRMIRLFITEPARLQLPPGEAFSQIIEKIKYICHEGPIIGMVLTDITPLGWEPKSTQSPKCWLDAKSALEIRGFEDSGETITEVIGQGNERVAISFRWYTWPPRSEDGLAAYARSRERFAQIGRENQERLAPAFSILGSTGGTVEVFCSASDAFALAHGSPGNSFYAHTFQSSDHTANRKGVRGNLYSAPHGTEGAIPPNSAHASVVLGILPDIATNASSTDALANISMFLEKRAESLSQNGKLLIRGPVGPASDVLVELGLHPTATPSCCNGRTLVDVFKEFIETRLEQHIAPQKWDQVFDRGEPTVDGEYHKFTVPHSIASEFIAKYPYYRDWSNERARPYTVCSEDTLVKMLTETGLRINRSGAERSKWVASQFRDGLLSMSTLDGVPIDLSVTNHTIVAEKVGEDDGLTLSAGKELPLREKPFVQVSRYQMIDIATGKVVAMRDVGSRPKVTIDTVIHRVVNRRLFLAAREYLRPIMTVGRTLDESFLSGFGQEQISGIVQVGDIANEGERAALQIVKSRAGIDLTGKEAIRFHLQYLVRADTVDEEVVSYAIEKDDLPLADMVIDDAEVSFVGRYRVRALDAVKILQSNQVGFSTDSRLERIAYPLLQQNKLDPGPWLGATLPLQTQHVAITLTPLEEILKPHEKYRFEQCEVGERPFHRIHRREFLQEYALSSGRPPDRTILEYVLPDEETGLSHNSVAVLPVAKRLRDDGTEEILVGFELKALPAAQGRFGISTLATIPTIRIPSSINSMKGAERHAQHNLWQNLRIRCATLGSNGGKYMVSPGVTPETIYPMIAEVDIGQSNLDTLAWLPLSEAVSIIPSLRCGQAMTALWRAAHMYGLLARR